MQTALAIASKAVVSISRSLNDRLRSLSAGFLRLHQTHLRLSLPPGVRSSISRHQVDGEPVRPSRKTGFADEGLDLEMRAETAFDLTRLERRSERGPLPPAQRPFPGVQQIAGARMCQRQHVLHVQVTVLGAQVIQHDIVDQEIKRAGS